MAGLRVIYGVLKYLRGAWSRAGRVWLPVRQLQRGCVAMINHPGAAALQRRMWTEGRYRALLRMGDCELPLQRGAHFR